MDKTMNFEKIISQDEIYTKISELGQQITKDFQGKKLVVICVLKGAFIFTADLVRTIDLDFEIDFMHAKSYCGTNSSGIVNINKDNDIDVSSKDVLIVEDILDTGKTLSAISDYLKAKGANSVKICTFLDKPERRVVDLKADYFCFQIPNVFAIGYGLDYNQKFRNMPYVAKIIE